MSPLMLRQVAQGLAQTGKALSGMESVYPHFLSLTIGCGTGGPKGFSRRCGHRPHPPGSLYSLAMMKFGNGWRFALSLCCTAVPGWGLAAPFEIKVHDELIAQPQESAFEMEAHFVQSRSGLTPSSPGFQTRLEYGYGLNNKSEIAVNLYASQDHGVNYINGGKISHLFVPTHNEEGFWHYGIKNEVNTIRDSTSLTTTYFESTPILAMQWPQWRLTLNPSLDLTLNRHKSVTFAPSAKLAYQALSTTHVGMEYYTESAPMRQLFNYAHLPNTVYAVVDQQVGHSHISLGIGKGLTSVSDHRVIKLIAVLDLE